MPHMDPIPNAPDAILQELAAIPMILRGKLSVRHQGERQYFALQVWRDGHNRTTYVPKNAAEIVRQATDNAQRFEQLTEALATHLEALAQQRLHGQTPSQSDSKKNSARTSRPPARKKSPG